MSKKAEWLLKEAASNEDESLLNEQLVSKPDVLINILHAAAATTTTTTTTAATTTTTATTTATTAVTILQQQVSS